jgi:hypothetical protein
MSGITSMVCMAISLTLAIGFFIAACLAKPEPQRVPCCHASTVTDTFYG